MIFYVFSPEHLRLSNPPLFHHLTNNSGKHYRAVKLWCVGKKYWLWHHILWCPCILLCKDTTKCQIICVQEMQPSNVVRGEKRGGLERHECSGCPFDYIYDFWKRFQSNRSKFTSGTLKNQSNKLLKNQRGDILLSKAYTG